MKNRALKIIFWALLAGACLAMGVSAYGNSDIRLIYVGEGAAFSIYKIGSYDSEGSFAAEEAFKSYSVDFEDENSALTLAIYVERDGIKPMMTAVTDSEFKVIFSNLESGEYLILGDDFTLGNEVYTAQPVLASVSDGSEDQIDINEKYSVLYVDEEESGSKSISVMKVWSGDKAESITAQLLKDGSVYDEVVLSDSNSWRYTWSGLNENSAWRVIEKEVPDGYTLRVDEDGSVFILVNTEGSDETGGSGETTTDEPSEETTKESGGGGSETTTETEETTDSDTEETTDSHTETTTAKTGGGGGGGGGSYYSETTTEALTETTTEGGGSSDDTEETTAGSGESNGSGGSDGGSGSSGGSSSRDFSDNSSSGSGSDSSGDSSRVTDDSSERVTHGGEGEGGNGGRGSGGRPKLPQTGQLWLPVPIFLWLGIIFLVLGIRKKSVGL